MALVDNPRCDPAPDISQVGVAVFRADEVPESSALFAMDPVDPIQTLDNLYPAAPGLKQWEQVTGPGQDEDGIRGVSGVVSDFDPALRESGFEFQPERCAATYPFNLREDTNPGHGAIIPASALACTLTGVRSTPENSKLH
jgi:hypothetical protein